MKMKHRYLCLCLPCLLACQSSTEPVVTTAEAVEMIDQPGVSISDELNTLLDQIEAATSGISSIQSRVRYDTLNELTLDDQRRFGDLTYQASTDDTPTQFHIHFHTMFIDGDQQRNIDQAYICDGQRVADINRETRSYNAYPLSEDQQEDAFRFGDGPLPLPLNLKKVDLLERFEIQIIAESSSQDPSDETIHLRLTPKPGQSIEAAYLDLWFDPATHRPVQAGALDNSGLQKTVRLLAPTFNETIEETVFDTSPPQGNEATGWSIDLGS